MLVVGVAAILANLLAGPTTQPPPEIAHVSFTSRVTAYNDAGNVRRAKRVPAARTRAEEGQILQLLNDLYQRTFVDPSVFEAPDTGEGGIPAFPSADVLEHFAEDARAAVVTDIDAATLGSERETFQRVDPTATTARISIYFRNGKDASLATARVEFAATGTLVDETAFPVSITQEATFHLAREQGRWVIVFYEAEQSQDSILPTTSPTEGAS